MTQKSSGYIKQESTKQKGGIPSGYRKAVILKYRDTLTHQKTADKNTHTEKERERKTDTHKHTEKDTEKKEREREKKERERKKKEREREKERNKEKRESWGSRASKGGTAPTGPGSFQKWNTTNSHRHPGIASGSCQKLDKTKKERNLGAGQAQQKLTTNNHTYHQEAFKSGTRPNPQQIQSNTNQKDMSHLWQLKAAKGGTFHTTVVL